MGASSSTSRPTIIAARPSTVASRVGTVAITRPPRSTVTRSATAITSWSLWVMTITEWPRPPSPGAS